MKPIAVLTIALGFLSGCVTHQAAVKGDLAALRLQPIQRLDECKLCMAGVRTSALGCAAAAGKVDAVKALLAMGAKPTNCRGNPWGRGEWQPLGMAAQHGQTEIVRLLLEAGADASYNDGMFCPLHYAGDRGPIVKLLLDAGADPSCRSPLSKLTALETAEKFGYSTALRLMRQGAVPSASAPIAAAAAPSAPPPSKAIRSDVDQLPAAGPSRRGHALVIGVESYRESLPRADFAARDARIVAEYAKRVLGYPEANVALLIDDRATRGDFEKYFERWLPNRVEKEDEVLVYFSGHGAPNAKNGEAYLVPYDGDPTYVAETGYPLKRLYGALAKLSAKKVTVALDSCFSGAGGRSVIAKGARPLVSVSHAGVPSGLTVIAAAAGDQISNSYQEQGHGLFTYFLLKGLKERGPDWRKAFDYLKPEVAKVARREYNADQDPQWREGK